MIPIAIGVSLLYIRYKIRMKKKINLCSMPVSFKASSIHQARKYPFSLKSSVSGSRSLLSQGRPVAASKGSDSVGGFLVSKIEIACVGVNSAN